MKNLLKVFALSVFILFMSASPALAIYKLNSFSLTQATVLVPTVGVSPYSINGKSVPYNGNAQVQWSTQGFDDCICSYIDPNTGKTTFCGTGVSPLGTNNVILSLSTALQALKVFSTGQKITVKLSCTPTPCMTGSVVFDTAGNGTWPVPNGLINCTGIKFEAWGAGGGGAGGPAGHLGGIGPAVKGAGGGGGSGGYSSITKILNPGSVVSFKIGTGGNAGDGGTPPSAANQPTDGTDGGSTTVNVDAFTTVTAGGGRAGHAVAAGAGSGGAGGSGTIAGENGYKGGDDGSGSSDYSIGGKGGKSYGAISGQSNYPGLGGRGGGGGSTYIDSNGIAQPEPGGKGHVGISGRVKISWY